MFRMAFMYLSVLSRPFMSRSASPDWTMATALVAATVSVVAWTMRKRSWGRAWS